MSRKCGMPWMKLNSKSYSIGSKKAEHHGNNKAVMCEALKERWSRDKDLDRSKTKHNLYYGYDSGLQLLSDIDKEIADMSEKLRRNGKRGIREDAITSFAGIVKPDKEVMENLTLKQRICFFRDALDLLIEKFGVNPKTGKNNIRSAVIQVDEGNVHMHYFGVPYTKDGRLSAKEVFTPKLSRWLNEEFPKLMNERGWNLELCRDEESYQPEIAQTLNERELEVYKKKCIEHKRSRQKQHGKNSDDYKIQKEVEKATKQEKQRLQQKEQIYAQKANAVLEAENALILNGEEVAKREQAVEQKEANLVIYEKLGVNYYNRAKNLFNCLEREDKEFQANKARLYNQSLDNIAELHAELDESLLPHPGRQRERQKSL